METIMSTPPNNIENDSVVSLDSNSLTALLDHTFAIITRANDASSADTTETKHNLAFAVVADLAHALSQMRDACNTQQTSEENKSAWKVIVAHCRSHPLLATLHTDPLSSRCFHKPRSYAGDAVMLDYIYFGCSPSEYTKLSPLAKVIHDVTRATPCGFAVRERAVKVGILLDEMLSDSRQKATFRVLSIASGHGREIITSKLAPKNSLLEVTLLDSDAESLAYAKADLERRQIRVRTVHCPISSLFNPKNVAQLGAFDFVYSCGLFDYLNDKTGARLLKIMAEQLLVPGGRVLWANFQTHLFSAYMTTFLDWNLIHRTISDLERMGAQLNPRLVHAKRYYTDSLNVIVYGEIDTKNEVAVDSMMVQPRQVPTILEFVGSHPKPATTSQHLRSAL